MSTHPVEPVRRGHGLTRLECAMNRTKPAGGAASWLTPMIRLTALGYLVFFGPDLVLSATDHIDDLPQTLTQLLAWGQGGHSVDVMLSTIYVVWALFLFVSARDPIANRLFIDFSLVANTAHFAAMLIMAATMPDEHHHIPGVVLLGLVSNLPLALSWIPVRRAAQTEYSSRTL
jgi:hypothetical protein